MSKLKNLFKGKSRSEIVSTIIYVMLIIVMVICLVIKVKVMIEFADVPIGEVPAWAMPWLK